METQITSEIGDQSQYSDKDRMAIHRLACKLHERDDPYPRGTPPAAYMRIYSKAAAAIYRLAGILSETPPVMNGPLRSREHWIRVLTQENCGNMGFSSITQLEGDPHGNKSD